jgi:hypothetical protein
MLLSCHGPISYQEANEENRCRHGNQYLEKNTNDSFHCTHIRDIDLLFSITYFTIPYFPHHVREILSHIKYDILQVNKE